MLSVSQHTGCLSASSLRFLLPTDYASKIFPRNVLLLPVSFCFAFNHRGLQTWFSSPWGSCYLLCFFSDVHKLNQLSSCDYYLSSLLDSFLPHLDLGKTLNKPAALTSCFIVDASTQKDVLMFTNAISSHPFFLVLLEAFVSKPTEAYF